MSDRIETMEQLSSTLVYLGKMADMLEGLRLYYGESGRNQFPVEASGPIHELRKNLALAREFAEREMVTQQAPENGASTNGHTTATTPNVLIEV